MMGGRPESSFKCPATEVYQCCQFFNADPVIDMLFNISLHLFDLRITMFFLSVEHGKCRLAVAVNINRKIFGSQDGRFPVTVFFHQMQQEVPVGICSSAGIDSIFFRYDISFYRFQLPETCS